MVDRQAKQYVQYADKHLRVQKGRELSLWSRGA